MRPSHDRNSVRGTKRERKTDTSTETFGFVLLSEQGLQRKQHMGNERERVNIQSLS